MTDPSDLPVAKLMEVQDLDRAADRLRVKRRDLPERAFLVQCEASATSLDQSLAEMQQSRDELAASERSVGGEVAALAAKVKQVEDNLYSGSVTVPKELSALQEEVRLLKAKQSDLEDRELEIMEQMERADAEMAENRTEHSANAERAAALVSAIRKAELEINGELPELSSARDIASSNIPVGVLAKYDDLRKLARLAGRAAARLENGGCGGCQVRLPVIEYNRIKHEPPDALVRCSHCGRVLVR